MSNGYTQPYESLNSTAQLIRLPTKGGRSKSVGRSFWTQIMSRGTLAPATVSPHQERKSRRESQTPSGRKPLVLNSTGSTNPNASLSSSRNLNSRTSQLSYNTPTPTPRSSLSRSSNSGSESNAIMKANNINTFLDNTTLNSPSRKTRTTVTVHLSKSSKTSSTPNLLDLPNSSTNEVFQHRVNDTNESLSRSMTNVRSSFPSENSPSVKAIPKVTKHLSSSVSDVDENTQLNSWQVFRQPRYKNRDKTMRRIKQFEHLNQNERCNELVNQLSKGVQPNDYENQHPLKLVDFVTQEGFVTSSKSLPAAKHSPKKPILPPPPVNIKRVRQEPIYSEINDLNIHPSPNTVHTPTMRKRVTFSTFHEPIQEGDPTTKNKKILPAKFWGIVQVTEALRSKTDEERRSMANFCYQAILTGSSHSSKFLGRVENSRWGENVYVLLLSNGFEIRDSEGLVLAQHALGDVSVVSQAEDDPNLFIYIGRCRYNGRIGMALRFNKPKYTTFVLNAFKK